ncbi:MAG: hypothetical protein WD775_11030 [Burkholderiales bacterium]
MRGLAVVLSFAGVLPFAAGVGAHGTDWELRMTGKRVDAYDLTVRTSPKRPRTGHLHIEAQLIDPRTLAYVEHAKVSALARPGDGTVGQAGPVSSRYRRPWHEMDLVLNKSGAWQVQIVIDGPRAQGKASFRVDVSN